MLTVHHGSTTSVRTTLRDLQTRHFPLRSLVRFYKKKFFIFVVAVTLYHIAATAAAGNVQK